MKIEIVSIGTELLNSDILDTNAAYISRCLREIEVSLTAKVTVGDQLEMIAHVIEVALERADAVIMTGGLGSGEQDFTRDAIARVLGHKHLNLEISSGTLELLQSMPQYGHGIKIESEKGTLIALPGNRKALAYLLEAEVLPYLRGEATAVSKTSNWLLLRTVDIMESSIKQELADVATGLHHRITYDFFAGQTNIRIWAEHITSELVQKELDRVKAVVEERLGDFIFGGKKDLLEQIVLDLLAQSNLTLSIGECYTNQVFANALAQFSDHAAQVKFQHTETCTELLQKLNLSVDKDTPVVQRSRTAVTAMRNIDQTNLALLVHKQVSQGGIQVLIILASEHGENVTQRSFGGHPENIDQWALTLGLAHLRRWLLNQPS